MIGFKDYDPHNWFNTFYLNEVYGVEFWDTSLFDDFVISVKNVSCHGVSFTKIEYQGISY